MISASHNPFGDNGIKLFAAGGRKLADDVEAALEAEIDAAARRPTSARGRPRRRGRRGRRGREPIDARTSDAVARALEGRRLDGLRGRGRLRQRRRARGRARACSARSGPRSTVIHAEPDGSQHQRRLRLDPPGRPAATRWSRAAPTSGSRFDGDADRVLAVDATGALVDGDQIIAICAHRPARARAGCATTRSSSR